MPEASGPFTPTPARRLEGVRAYAPPDRGAGGVLRLDANEGPCPDADALSLLASAPGESLRRYPDAGGLERAIAARWGVAAERVVVTNGGDDAIDRLCRCVLEPGRSLLVHEPTFEMIARSARLADGEVRAVPWPGGALDVEGYREAITPGVALVAVVSPNNPTGSVVGVDGLRRIAAAARARGALLLADLAYVEYTDEDPTPALLEEPNAVVVRTFSKALGLAGLRVGYAIAPEPVCGWLRAAGSPFPVAGPSLLVASRALADQPASHVARVREERALLADHLASRGAGVEPSQANFMLVRVDDAEGVWRRLLEAGVSVRRFGVGRGLDDALRVTMPGHAEGFGRLLEAFDYALGAGPKPEPAGQATGARRAVLTRRTAETYIRCRLALDGTGRASVRTGLGMLDHLLEALCRHGGMDLELHADGDLHIDDHHTVEDCAIVLGSAIDRALGERRGIARFGDAHAPLDEALCRCVVDLSGRASATVDLGLRRPSLGDVSCENITHFLSTLAQSMRAALHVDALRGENDHHRAEAAFKALALALRRALAPSGDPAGVPSTKGVLVDTPGAAP